MIEILKDRIREIVAAGMDAEIDPYDISSLILEETWKALNEHGLDVSHIDIGQIEYSPYTFSESD